MLHKKTSIALSCLLFLFFSCKSSDADSSPPSHKNGVIRYTQPQLQLANADFELGQIGWKQMALFIVGNSIESDTAEAINGTRSLKINFNNAQTFRAAEFRLVSPWLTLAGGGKFTFSAYIKSDKPEQNISLRIINGFSKKASKQGKQSRKRFAKDFDTSNSWTQITFTGSLPAAAKNAYRLAFELEPEGVYWIDAVEFQHNGKSICSKPAIEAGLQPADLNKKIYDAPADIPVDAWITNRSNKQRAFELLVKQSAQLREVTSEQRFNFTVAANQSLRQQLNFKLNGADVYRIDWQFLDDNGQQINQGFFSIGTSNTQLSRASGGEPVWGMHLSGLNLDVSLPLLRDAGVTHLRNLLNFYWNLIEKRQSRLRWPDKLYRFLDEQGFQTLGTVGFPPRWASMPIKPGGSRRQNKMPRSFDTYRQYLHDVVDRYGSGVKIWEVWNEPNLPRYFEGTPEEYGQLLKVSVEAIKEKQPDAQVAGMSLAWSDKNLTDFMRSALTAGEPNPDAISFHPYEKTSPEQAGMVMKIKTLQENFAKLRNYTPALWATETGFRARDSINKAIPYYSPPRPRTVRTMKQAEYVVRHAILAKTAGVKYYFLYSLDSERPKRGPDIHGLLDYDWAGSVKPALLAYTTLVQLCGDAQFENRENLNNEQQYLLHFRRKDGKRLSLLWQVEGESSINLPSSLQEAESYDLFGNRIESSNNEQIKLQTRPVYFLN